MFSGAPRRPSAHNQFAVSSRLRIKGVFGKEGGIRLPHRSEQSGSGVPSTSTGQSQLWKLQKCNRGNRGGVDSASFGNCICAIGVVGMGPTCAEARNPGQSAAQSPSSPSAGGSGAAPVIGVNYYCRCASIIFAGRPPVEDAFELPRSDSWGRRTPGWPSGGRSCQWQLQWP